MTSSSSSPQTENPIENGSSTALPESTSLWRTLLGAGIASGLGYGFYRLLQTISQHLPAIPVDVAPIARSLSLVVRYFLVGSIALMAFMFAAVGLGLLAYSGQLLIQRLVPTPKN
ncbi:MAG: DUF3082 domain-containing protein [Synechococcaceae cyanobacterium SM2_3_1]|nr:DUF3082 domain-containing protein [Synechococcaceae cyanobacterium SM2_3_1]